MGFAEAFATAGGLKRLRKLLDSSHSVVVRFASGALKNITDSYDHRPSSTEAENEAAEAGVRSTFRRLSLLHRPGKQAKRRMPALLGDKGVQAAVRARSSEDARDKHLEAEAATTLQVQTFQNPPPPFPFPLICTPAPQASYRGARGRLHASRTAREAEAAAVLAAAVRHSPWVSRARRRVAAVRHPVNEPQPPPSTHLSPQLVALALCTYPSRDAIAQVRLQSARRGNTARTMSSRQLFAVVAVQAHWRGLAGRRGAVRRRRLAELYATEDATEGEAAGTAEVLQPIAAPRQRSTLSRGARTALRDAEAEAAAGEEGAAAALLTSRLLAENLRFRDGLKPHLRAIYSPRPQEVAPPHQRSRTHTHQAWRRPTPLARGSHSRAAAAAIATSPPYRLRRRPRPRSTPLAAARLAKPLPTEPRRCGRHPPGFGTARGPAQSKRGAAAVTTSTAA